MTTQPTALRLADEYAADGWIVGTREWCEEAAAELRRLHEENELLKMSQYGAGRLQALRAQRDELLAAGKLVIAWFEAEDDHSKTDFYQRMEMCRESEAALRAAIAKVEASK